MERTRTSRGRAGAKKSSQGSSTRRSSTRKTSSARSTGTARKKSSTRKTSSRRAASSAKGTATKARRTSGRRYGRKAQQKVGEIMHEMKEGELRSSTGKKVTNPKQAIAIGLSEARRAGDKVPPRPRRSRKSKSAST